MDKTILFKVLQIDSLMPFLTWDDRIKIHLFLTDKASDLSTAIINTGEWIIKYGWEPPFMYYGHDRLLYYEADGKQFPAEDYSKNFKTIK